MAAIDKESALLDIAAIEEALRAGYAPRGGKPVQRVPGAIAVAAKARGVSRQTMDDRVAPGGVYERMGLFVDWFVKAPEDVAPLRKEPQPVTESDKLRAARGELGFKPVLPGYEIKRTSTQFGPNGDTRKEWVQQERERGNVFEMPEGHLVKGVSALIGADGRTIQQWVKTREGDNSLLLVDAIKTAFTEYTGRAGLCEAPAHTDSDLATFYVIGDHHLGLYAWGRETGENYDLRIGEQILIDAMGALVANAPKSSTAVILNLGDFFHSDNTDNRTAKSGNALDVDGRYGKVLQVGIKLMVSCIEMALQKHDNVIVRCLPGNHDPHTSLALSAALSAFFHVDYRVTIDCDPSKFFKWRLGKVMVAATHGDMVKPERMPGVMAAMWPVEWGETRFRFAMFGHVHHKSKIAGECDGVVTETFQTLSAKDSWHSGMGYQSGRSMVAITYHQNKGEVLRHTVSVGEFGKI